MKTAFERHSGWKQVRRCHKCGHVNEADEHRVLKCDQCGVHFAPFFFAELTPDVVKTLKFVESSFVGGRGRPRSLAFSTARDYRAIVGLTWWWDSRA